MDIIKLDYAARLVGCLLAGVLLAGCSEQLLPAATGPDAPAGTFCFRLPEADHTRITYDGIFSDFQENDTVGCLIYTRDAGGEFSYAANAKWHYYNAVLVLDKVFEYKEWSPTSTDVTGLISRLNPGSQDGYLKIEAADKELAFYFYYPYADLANLTKDVSDALVAYSEDQASTDFYRLPGYPNWVGCTGLTFTDEYGNNKNLESATVQDYTLRYTACALPSSGYQKEWRMAATAFPCFVNHTQQSKEQLNHSDFLWVKCERDYLGKPITQACNHSIPLEFEKKTATVEIRADVALSDVCFQDENASIAMGTEINLLTGALTPYDRLTGVPDNEKKRKLLKENHRNMTKRLLPYAYEGNRKFRMTFVPQSGFDCRLSFTINGTAHQIDLGERIMELKEGNLYTIHINRLGDYSITIQDWEFGHIEFIEPVETTPSNP